MLWSEEDGLEMSYPCGNHLSMARFIPCVPESLFILALSFTPFLMDDPYRNVDVSQSFFIL